MSDTRAAMKLIGGIEPTPQQVQRVQAIAHSLDIPANDAMMPILIMLDAYYGAFSALPERAQKAADRAAESAERQSKVTVDKSVALAIQNLSPAAEKAFGAVVEKITETQHEKETKEKFQWIAGSIVISTLALCLIAWVMHSTAFESGFESGSVAGYEKAKNEIAAASWANTEQGQLAHDLANAGGLEKVARCEGKGWQLKDQTCTPFPIKEDGDLMAYGWKVGKYATGNMSKVKHWYN